MSQKKLQGVKINMNMIMNRSKLTDIIIISINLEKNFACILLLSFYTILSDVFFLNMTELKENTTEKNSHN